VFHEVRRSPRFDALQLTRKNIERGRNLNNVTIDQEELGDCRMRVQVKWKGSNLKANCDQQLFKFTRGGEEPKRDVEPAAREGSSRIEEGGRSQ